MKYQALTKAQELRLSDFIQKELGRLRRKLGAAIDDNATPETVMAAAKARRWDVSAIEKARDQLVNACFPWALRLAERASQNEIPGIEYDDLKQSALMGLMLAALRFKADLAKWTTYATWWIRQSMARAVRNDTSIIRVPEYLLYKKNRLDETEQARLQQIMTVNHGWRYPEATIETKLPVEIRHELERILTERELLVIVYRFLVVPRVTLRDISLKIGLSRERVRQIELEALKKLRKSDILRAEYES